MAEPTHISAINTSYKPVIRIRYMPYRMDIAKDMFFSICKMLCEKFETSSEFDRVVENLIKYAHGDDSGRLDVLKGLGIFGPTGARKTFIMLSLLRYLSIDDVHYVRDRKMITFRFKIIPSRQIVGEFSNDGYDVIAKYSSLNIICIDDLGTEPPQVLHFGNKVNVIEALIEERYTKNLLTHFTTNLTEDKIYEVYGDRVRSRLKQSVNFIELIDKDYRLI